MINNKKGLSAIVATLMIILLVLIAVGIIWVVVRNVVESGTQNIDIGAKCLEVDVRATAVSPTNQVTLERGAGGINIDEANGGVVIVFTDGLNSESFDLWKDGGLEENKLNPLDTKTTVGLEGLTGADMVQVTVYFKNDKGESQLCGTTTEYSFTPEPA